MIFEQRSRLAVSHFARALNVKQHSMHVMALCPKTLNDALQIALAFENAEKMVSDNKSYSVMAYGDEDDQKPVAACQFQPKGKGGKRKKGKQSRDGGSPVAQPVPPAPRDSGSKQGQGQTQPSVALTDEIEWKSMMISQMNALRGQLQQLTGNRQQTFQSSEQRMTAVSVQDIAGRIPVTIVARKNIFNAIVLILAGHEAGHVRKTGKAARATGTLTARANSRVDEGSASS